MTAFPLEEGDTGEALLPDLLEHDDDAPGQVVQPLLEVVRRVPPATGTFGLPEHLADLNGKIAGLQLDLASAEVAHAQTLLDTASERQSLEWEIAYWEWGAKYGRRARMWRSGFDRWTLRVYRGGDEYGRHTLVVGPWVIALWSCRCAECKADRAQLEAVLNPPEEQS